MKTIDMDVFFKGKRGVKSFVDTSIVLPDEVDLRGEKRDEQPTVFLNDLNQVVGVRRIPAGQDITEEWKRAQNALYFGT